MSIRKAIGRFLTSMLLFAGTATAQQQSTVASPNFTPGWATFGQILPKGAAVNSVAVGNLPTQTDVKNRWPDGSIRFAVVTAKIPSVGIYAITPASGASGTFTPTVPNVRVQFTIGGTVYTATVPGPTADIWLSGSLVKEWRTIVTPTTSSGAEHSFLRVYFDTRVYNDSSARVDLTVENNIDIAGATQITYDIAVISNNTTLFSQASVTHPWLTRWRKVFSVGLSASQVTPDFEPIFQANSLPRYLSYVTNLILSPTGSNFTILQAGSLNPYMGDVGGRPEIAPYPDWTARYIVHKNSTQGQYVMAHGDLAGSWPIHIREADGTLVSLDARPNFWLDGRCTNDGISCPRGNLTATGPLKPDAAHQPSLAYVPYLVSGDRYYVDEMAFWANYNLLASWFVPRNGSAGLIYNLQTRGLGWGLRNLGDAATYLPDSYPVKGYLLTKVNNNLQWADDYANGVLTGRYWGVNFAPVSPLGASIPYDSGSGTANVAQWETNFVAWAIDHLWQQGFTKGLAFRDRVAKFQIKMFNSEPEFPRICAAPYRPSIGTMGANGVVQYYTSMLQLAQLGNACGTQFAGYYGVDARLMLMIGIREGWAGAQQAYDYLNPILYGIVPPPDQWTSDLANRAGWSDRLRKWHRRN